MNKLNSVKFASTKESSPALKEFLYKLALRQMSDALKQEAFDNNLFNKENNNVQTSS